MPPNMNFNINLTAAINTAARNTLPASWGPAPPTATPAKPGFLAQAGSNLAGAFTGQGGAAAAMQKQFALMGMGGVGSAVGSIAGGSAAFGPIGAAAAALHVAFDLAKTGVHKFIAVVNEFVERGEVLQRYNGAVAGARASAKVRGIFADIREANALGGDTARLTDAQSRIMTEIRDLILPLKRWILEKLAGVMEKLADAAEELGPGMAAVIEFLGGMLDVLADLSKGDLIEALSDLNKTGLRIQAALNPNREPSDKLLFELFQAFGEQNVPGLGGRADPILERQRQALNAPALGAG